MSHAPNMDTNTTDRSENPAAPGVGSGALFGVVWESVNIPGGRKKWIEVRSKSWVTDTEYGRHLGYRGEYIGVEQMTTEECKDWIGAMLDYFHAPLPNKELSNSDPS